MAFELFLCNLPFIPSPKEKGKNKTIFTFFPKKIRFSFAAQCSPTPFSTCFHCRGDLAFSRATFPGLHGKYTQRQWALIRTVRTRKDSLSSPKCLITSSGLSREANTFECPSHPKHKSEPWITAKSRLWGKSTYSRLNSLFTSRVNK